MRLFPQPLIIGDEEGFDASKDIFGRAKLGEGLTNLISASKDPIVVAVDGPWGSGKTVFLKMWAGTLRKAGFPVVYFDAFENDHADDAFAAIASEIIELAQKKKSEGKSQKEKFISKAVAASKVLLRSGIKVGVRAATIGALDAADLQAIAEAAGDEASTLSDKYLGEVLTGRRKAKGALEEFRASLSELPAILGPSIKNTGDDKSEHKPLIFIIDELDRCRPSFALELLERIKHFFSVPNVHFVLGVHLNQLCESVRVTYGPDINAQIYFQKFIHLVFYLVQNTQYPSSDSIRYINHLITEMQFPAEDERWIHEVGRCVSLIADQRNLSLRIIERIMTLIAVTATFSRNRMRHQPVLAGLCILKVIAPELFQKAKRGELTYEEVKPYFSVSTGVVSDNEGIARYMSLWWQYCTDPNPPEDMKEQMRSSLFNYPIRRPEELVQLVANDVVDRFTIQ